MPTWFITGCSTGFGRQLALEVLSRGWQAVITARNPADIVDIAATNPDRCLALALDVTDRGAINGVVAKAIKRFREIDVLVNNAGYGYRSAVEEGEEEEIRKVFETNVFGLTFVTQAVLPHMRARRRGHIVNLSSIAGRMAQPGSGFYAGTKFAVEGISDALRKELEPLGIGVMLVEPGGFRTDFAGRSLRQSKQPIADYATTAGTRRKENSNLDGNQPGDPVRAINAILDALASKTPPFRLVLGRDASRRLKDELQAQLRELETWTQVAVDADFPT
ncbi:NAD(P)-dependent dehydrogenase (short-subunit alcohol dehydrogenase family) [Rhizobium sp. BK313]|uniref:oxidoreductase n=1 Tax=Rhizobium sp. BK313 TaxID=2587081 RepID=UPI00105DB4A4|nr:oxidoreductase [Rhizobium sp. BK313]MBB3459345.1 NAD(P)-dependent dehydrogenase (short-subunit alcohol dehydrogenase family) [Rhizobium sp. BK313]